MTSDIILYVRAGQIETASATLLLLWPSGRSLDSASPKGVVDSAGTSTCSTGRWPATT